MINDNFMLINVKIKKKKCFSSDTRTTQNYSSEPHNRLRPQLSITLPII